MAESEHDLHGLGPLEKVFQVWDEWDEGEDIETLPIEEVDSLLAEMGLNPEGLISSIRGFVESKNAKEPKGEQKIERDLERYTC